MMQRVPVHQTSVPRLADRRGDRHRGALAHTERDEHHAGNILMAFGLQCVWQGDGKPPPSEHTK